MRLLIVDDEGALREILAEEFESHGAIVTSAGDGRAALELWRPDRFDAVLSDMRMPEIDGLTLVRRARAAGDLRTPVLLCSGYNDIDDEERRKLGIVEVFAKPFKVSELLARVAQLRAPKRD